MNQNTSRYAAALAANHWPFVYDGSHILAADLHEFSSVQARPSPEVSDRFLNLVRKVVPSDLVTSWEHTPHITILYGIHTERVEPVLSAVGSFSYDHPQLEVTVKNLELFEGDESDTLVQLVDGPDVRRLRTKLMNLPNTQTFPVYRPHMTIAFLRKGHNLNLTGRVTGLEGLTIALTPEFSSRNGTVTQL